MSTNNSLVQIQIKTPPTRVEHRLQTGTTTSISIDRKNLEKELLHEIKGEVRFAESDCGLYASDASNYRMIPLGVILPKDAKDVETAVAL